MWKLKNYRLGFDWHGLLMALSFISPYIIWFFVRSRDGFLRKESVTVIVDIFKVAANICMIFLTTFLINDTRSKKVMKIFMFILFIPRIFYYVGWILLYFGISSKFIILDVCIAPCVSYLLFSLSRKNLMSFFAVLVYTTCEIIFTVYNFIL